jgi:four helix bundle protein
MGVHRFTELRAWQVCNTYKKAIYRLCATGPLARDFERRDQLERSAARPCAHVSEGFGRFSPPDFARYCVMARSSLMESQNHLMDCVDRGHISEAARLEHNALAEAALEEVTGLMEYLQSPEALRNARRARERRIERRAKREPRTKKLELNSELNSEPNSEPEDEPRRENSEG